MLDTLVPIESRPGYMWPTINPLLGKKCVLPREVREPVKNYLADFFRQGWGGVAPPIPLRVFGQNDFPLRGGEGWGNPHSL